MACVGDKIVAAAQADLGSPNDFGTPGAFCSVAVKKWMDAAGAPIAGSPGAKTTKAQFEAKGLWLPVSRIRENPEIVKSGMIAVWHRGEPGACTGHIGIVTGPVVGGGFPTIEANAAPTVSRFKRDLGADNLLGMGYFPCEIEGSNALLVVGAVAAGAAGVWLALRDAKVRRWLRLPRLQR